MSSKNQGNAAFNRKEYAKAKECYDRAIELDGKCANFYFNRSATYFCLKDLPRALSDAQLAVDYLPENTSALARLGFTLLKCRKLDEAEDIYKRALALEPQSQRCIRGLQRVKDAQHAAAAAHGAAAGGGAGGAGGADAAGGAAPAGGGE